MYKQLCIFKVIYIYKGLTIKSFVNYVVLDKLQLVYFSYPIFFNVNNKVNKQKE